ncbi:ATP-binding protein [Paenibacillus piri]|uniref:histidine kinase n=1 Tax=Paenibacillus piri TaxID=2547395 RepID=A0A4R5KPT3_9BACL|nr:ATP-binding protein [Paenibacillus piri]TDF97701.1 two-component sensor histidine kinase [Paenibacillus piri]
MNILRHLLLNMLIIIMPVMLYHVFWIDRVHKFQQIVNRQIITILCTIASLLCIAMGLELSPGHVYDLRGVPLVILILYAGRKSAWFAAAAILAFRFYLGGSLAACLMSVVCIVATMIFISLCKPFITGQSKLRNVLFAAAAGFISGIIVSIPAFLTLLWENIPITWSTIAFFGLFSCIHSVTLSLAIWIIEQFKTNLSLRRQYQQSEKMDALSGLAASFAHEIRNPMTVARGFMQMLKQPGINEEKRQIYTQMVIEEIDKAQAMITNYLAFAKPHLESIELLDAKPLIQQAIQSILSYASLSKVEVVAEMDERLFISVNKEKFVQCIVQLCKNGIEAMPGGGKLKINAAVQADYVCIDIIDHGVGMTPEEIRRLGTPFYSTRNKGTGLGMMVTYKAIQTFQGKIDVTSEVGKGTCFSLMLPSLSPASFH